MDFVYFLIGLFVLFLNKIRYPLFGYQRPRDFSSKDIKRAVAYDKQVVEGWLKHLKKYSSSDNIKGKSVLELGPGADLGTGLILLARGASHYSALDTNNLAGDFSNRFYDYLINNISGDKRDLLSELDKLREGKPNKFQYIVDKKFDLKRFSDIDLIFSQAAFEHFNDVSRVAEGLFKIASRGAILVAEIDLRTHTGILAGRDPLNIYRYPKFIYNLFRFKGIPNRLRPQDYEEIFSEAGFKDIAIYPLKKLADTDLARVKNSLSSEFKNKDGQMEYLSIILCAKK